MTIQEMSSYFDVLQDKFNAPYFVSAEKAQFLNRAQVKYVNQLDSGYTTGLSLPRRGSVTTTPHETTTPSVEALQPLIVLGVSVTTGGGGLITNTAINAALSAKISAPNSVKKHVLAASRKHNLEFKVARFVRANDFYKLQSNSFKKATNQSPIYQIDRGGLTFAPFEAGVQVLLDIMKEPIEMSIDNGISCELPDWTHDDIVYIALELAGVATRDQLLNAMVDAPTD